MGNRGGDKRDRKKTSWIYRKKTRIQRSKKKAENANDNVQLQNKKARIIVRNLPFKTSEDEVRQFYGKFGEIEEINLLRHPDGKLVGCGFVQFKRIEDASRAIFNTNKKEFQGRVISSSWAISKSKFCEKLQKNFTENEQNKDDNEDNDKDDDQDDSILDESDIEECDEKQNKNRIGNKVARNKDKDENEVDQKKTFKKEETLAEKQKRRKLHKEKSRKKRARIVIRNVPFQATEENLKEHFSQYGNIEEVSILTREDGKSVGCAFVQFDRVQSAAKAIHYANMQPLLGRPIVVDWAVSKTKFIKKEQDSETPEIKVEIKEEDIDESEIKEENDSDSNGDIKTLDITDSSNVKSSHSDEEFDSEDAQSDNMDIKDESASEDDMSEEELSEIKEEDIESDDVEELDEEEADDVKREEEEEEEEEEEVKRPRYESHDVNEGKTVFLKNVPFSVKNDELKKYMERFGPVYYALVCIDPLTEHSKGTAFVKFKNIEDAEKCLSAGDDLRMHDEILEAHKALDRKEVEDKEYMKKHKEKDSRNLYLVKEGVILAGSPAAAGVSAADMAKRLQIEQWKSQILRNLNMFVSRVRLVVHNLPPTLDDTKLRKIFERHSGPKAIIKEARVMRDLRNVDAKGVGKSKEYGFVSFTTHEDALRALRIINNNPNIFHKNRRPIVSFSIENRIMVNAKQRRIEKSREHNPLWPGNKEKRKREVTEENETKTKKRPKLEKLNEPDEKPYAGTVGKLGENKLRSKFKLKNQALIHSQTVKKEKKMNKSSKKLQAKKKENDMAKKEIKPKQGMKISSEDVSLDRLVDSYKNKLQSISLKKSKWYET